jgi:hypothetical protein
MNTAPGVAYLTLDGCARRFFKCGPLRSTLSTEGCAANWRLAQTSSQDEMGFTGSKCRQCPIGAAHAGEPFIHRSKLFGVQICPRTRRWASRLISDRLGVGAYNRQTEALRGFNAKGTKPLLVLAPHRLGVVVGYGGPEQRYIELRDELTRDALGAALRRGKGQLAQTGRSSAAASGSLVNPKHPVEESDRRDLVAAG